MTEWKRGFSVLHCDFFPSNWINAHPVAIYHRFVRKQNETEKNRETKEEKKQQHLYNIQHRRVAQYTPLRLLIIIRRRRRKWAIEPWHLFTVCIAIFFFIYTFFSLLAVWIEHFHVFANTFAMWCVYIAK